MIMRHSKLAIVVLSLILGLAVASCGSSKSGKKKRGEGAEFAPELLDNFKAKGLERSKFQEVNPAPYGAGACTSGQVEGLAVLICQYESAAKAKASESKLLGFVQGAVTGLVRTRGDIGMVVADPDKMDLRGKNIAKIIKAFKK